MSRLITAGCGDRSYFSVKDYMDMGYGVSVSDMTVGYRMSHSGTRMNLDLDLVSRGMLRADTDIAIDLNPTAALNAQTAGDAKISQVKVAITDTGLNERRNNFCAGEAGVELSAYPEHHQQAWMREWNREGLEPSETLVNAYRSFTSGDSDTLTLAIDPYPTLSANDRAMSTDPTYLSGRLSPSVAVAGADPRSFSVTSVDPVIEPVAEDTGQEENTQAADPRDITGSLHQHINRDVRLTLTDGQRLDGRIKGIENGRVQFNRRLHGGTMVVPIPLARIQQARLTAD